MFSYEPDFNLLMHFIMDNIGESATIVQPKIPAPPYWDTNIGMIVNVNVNKSLIKFYTMNRDDTIKYLRNHRRVMSEKNEVTSKNVSSFALIELHKIKFQMFMKNGGGNIMVVDISKFDLHDFRSKSILDSKLKKIISSFAYEKAKARGEKPDTTALNIVFDEEESDDGDFEIELDDSKEEDKQPAQPKTTKAESKKRPETKASQMLKDKTKTKLRKKMLQRLRDLRRKELEKKKLKLEEQGKDNGGMNPQKGPGFVKKLMGCYWCRREKAQKKLAEKSKGNQATEGKIQKNEEVKNNDQEKDNTVQISFNPQKDGAEKFFSPQDNTIRDLFGDVHLNIEDETEIQTHKRNLMDERGASAEKIPLNSMKRTLMSPDSPVKAPPKDSVNLNMQQTDTHIESRHHQEHQSKYHSGHPQHYHRNHSHHRHNSRPQSVRFTPAKPTDDRKASEGYHPKFIINQHNECLRKSLPDREEKMFMDDPENDFFLFMEGGHNGEKSISIKLQNKTIILAADFITELVDYFTKPFNGSEKVPYWREMHFNNCAPMNMKIALKNASLLLLEDYTTLEKAENTKVRSLEPSDARKNCLLVAVNVDFTYKTLGDANVGPGSVAMGVDATLKKAHILKVDTVVDTHKNNPTLQIEGPDLSQVSVVIPFKVIYNTNYHLDVYNGDRDVKHPANYDVNFRIANEHFTKNNFRFAVGHFKALEKIYANAFAPSVSGPNSLAESKRREKEAEKRRKKEAEKKKKIKIADDEEEEGEDEEYKTEEDSEIKNIETVPQIPVKSTFKVRIPAFNISVYKILQETDLLKIQLSELCLNMKQNSESNSIMKAQATLSADYFNRRKVKLEPFIEPWKFACVREVKGASSTQLEIRNAVDPLFQPNERIEDNLHINSLNINLSTECIQTLLEVSKLFSGEMREDHPYCIINSTGSAIQLTLSNQTKPKLPIKKYDQCSLSWKFFNRDSKKSRQGIDGANNAYIDVVFLEDEKPEVLSANTRARSPTKLKGTLSPLRMSSAQLFNPKESKDTENELSDKERPTVRQVLCDNIGKTAYKIRKFGAAAKESSKGGGLFSLQLQGTKRLGNDSSTLNLIASVGINKITGMKEVTLRSPICFKNKLEQTMIIKIKAKTPPFEEEEYRLDKDEKFAFPLNVDPESAIIQFAVQDIGESEELKMKELLKDKTLMNEFSDEEMLSCDSESEFITHKDGYKRFEKDMIIPLKLPTKSDTARFNFCVTAFKRKVKSNLKKKSNQDFCWETYLVANPILYVTNAIPRLVSLRIGDQKIGKIEYGIVNMQFCPEQAVKDDVDFTFKVQKFEKSQGKKIFRRIDKIEEYVLKVKAKHEKGKGCQYFHMEVKKVTEFCRAVTIYCPYLIINDTKLPMSYQEASFTNKTISVDPYVKRRDKMLKKPRDLMKSETGFPNRSSTTVNQIDLEIISDKAKDATIDPNMTVAFGPGSGSMSSRVNVILDPYNTIHMFSPVRKPMKLQISLNEQVWSKSFSLQSTDGTLSLLESIQEIKRKQQERTNLYLSQFIKVGSKLVAKLKNTFLKRSQARREISRKKYEFSIKSETGVGVLSKSKIITITPRFSFRNEMNYFIAIKQDSIEDSDENRLKLKPNSWGHFYWADSTNCSAVQMSISDGNFTKFYGWSGSFKIDEVILTYQLIDVYWFLLFS